MTLDPKIENDSWSWKTERREYETITLRRIVSEHGQNDYPGLDDSAYSEETGCLLIEIFKKCLWCK